MTTPSDNTPLSIVTDGYFNAGLLQEGDTPNPEQLVRGMRVLTRLINTWQTEGLKLWLNVDTPVPLLAGTQTYTLGPAGSVVMTRPMRVLDGYWLDPSDVKTPLVGLSWQQWTQLSPLTNEGALNSYFVNKQQLTLDVSFYQTPDAVAAAGVAHVILQIQVAQFTNLTEEMNFPIEWGLALTWGVADELATGQPSAVIERCAGKAMQYKTTLENWDVEDVGTSFAPDSRGQYWNRSFR